MAHEVFRVRRRPHVHRLRGGLSGSTNAFTVGRSEEWSFVRERAFDTAEEATAYAVAENMRLNAFQGFIADADYMAGAASDRARDLLESGRALHRQVVFIGRPSKRELAALLERDGVRVDR